MQAYDPGCLGVTQSLLMGFIVCGRIHDIRMLRKRDRAGCVGAIDPRRAANERNENSKYCAAGKFSRIKGVG